MRLAHEVNHTDVSEFTIVATYLPLKKWRYIIPFLRMSGRIEKQVKKNSGVVRYGVRTDFTKKRFWTYSVWKSSEEMRHFVPLEPHGTAIKKFVKWGDKGAAFIDWKSTNGKIDWNEADQRLKTKGPTADSK